MSGEDKTANYDAIVIPGGGVDPETGRPRAWVEARLRLALTFDKRTRYYIVLSRGTPHRAPPCDARGHPIDESAASAKFLVQAGVNRERILCDSWSLDTIGNAYFTRAMIADPLQLGSLCIVTSKFHISRTKTVFDWVFGMEKVLFALDYAVAPDEGLSEEDLRARVKKEDAAVSALRNGPMKEIKDMRALASFVFVDHQAYAAGGNAGDAGDAKGSY